MPPPIILTPIYAKSGRITSFAPLGGRRPRNNNVEIEPDRPATISQLLHLNVWEGALVAVSPDSPLGLPPALTQALLTLAIGPAKRIAEISPLVRTKFLIWSDASRIPGATPVQNGAFREALHKDTLSASVPPPSERIARELRSRLTLRLVGEVDPEWVIGALRVMPGVAVVERVPTLLGPRAASSLDPMPGAIAKVVPDSEKPLWLHEMTSRDQLPDWNTLPCENVAVLDSGVIDGHPCLTGACKPPDANWFPYGMTDVFGHGTHVTSTIVGRGDDALAKELPGDVMPQGVLPAAKAFCYNIFNTTPTGGANGTFFELNLWAFYSALFAIRLKDPVSVVNMSIWMKDEPSQTILAEFAKLEAAGIVLVACAGNNFNNPLAADLGKDSSFRVLYPARLPNILSVAAVTNAYERAPFSRFSTWNTNGWNGNDYYGDEAKRWPLVDVAAPGIRIWGAAMSNASAAKFSKASIAPDREVNGYGAVRLRGTSMATPQVTAGIAAIRHQFPKWKSATAADVRQLVRDSVDLTNIPQTFESPLIKREEVLGAGLVDFQKLVQLAKQA